MGQLRLNVSACVAVSPEHCINRVGSRGVYLCPAWELALLWCFKIEIAIVLS